MYSYFFNPDRAYITGEVGRRGGGSGKVFQVWSSGRLRNWSRAAGLAKASTLGTGRPWITSRTASSVILPLMVRGMSATWMTFLGTWWGLVYSRIRLLIRAI